MREANTGAEGWLPEVLPDVPPPVTLAAGALFEV